MKRLFIILLLLLMCSPAWGTTYFLDTAADGNDDGTSWVDAWETLTAARAFLDGLGDNGSGDTVEVNDGSYGDFREVGVTRTDWLSYQAATGKQPDFTRCAVSNSVNADAYISFDGFKVTPLAGQINACRAREAHFVRFLNLEIVKDNNDTFVEDVAGNNYGIYLRDNSTNITVDGCTIKSTDSFNRRVDGWNIGIRSDADVNNVTVNDTEIAQCWNAGMTISGDNATVSDCNVHFYAGNAGILLGAGDNQEVSNTLFHNYKVYRPDLNETPTNTTWDVNGAVLTNANATWEVNEPFAWISGSEDRIKIIAVSGANIVTGDNDIQIESVDSPTQITLESRLAFSDIAFTSGGTREIFTSDTVVGATSGATGRIESVTVDTGSFAGGDAAGTLRLKFQTGAFQSETIGAQSADPPHNTNIANVAGNSTALQASNVDYYLEQSAHVDSLQQLGEMNNAVISKNKFFNAHGHQLFIVESTGTGNTIENNLFEADINTQVESNATVDLNGKDAGGLEFRNNTITGRLLIQNYVGLSMVSNIIGVFSPGTGGGVNIYDDVDHNIVNRGTDPNSEPNEGGNNLFYDGAWDNATFRALFNDFDTNDLTLAPGSTAIDFGDPVNSAPNDILGVARGGNPDAGAYEFVQADTTPPEPNPATFSTPPTELSSTSVTMTATTAIDDSTPVAYSFVETGGGDGATNSGWQASATHIDTGLTAGVEYTYTVQTRDSVPNTGTASSGSSVTITVGTFEPGSYDFGDGTGFKPGSRDF